MSHFPCTVSYIARNVQAVIRTLVRGEGNISTRFLMSTVDDWLQIFTCDKYIPFSIVFGIDRLMAWFALLVKATLM